MRRATQTVPFLQAARPKRAAFALCGGLNFQVEHHLFPLINHVHFPAISKIVKATAEEYSVPYIAYPTMWSALKSHLRLLKLFGEGKEYVHAEEQRVLVAEGV